MLRHAFGCQGDLPRPPGHRPHSKMAWLSKRAKKSRLSRARGLVLPQLGFTATTRVSRLAVQLLRWRKLLQGHSGCVTIGSAQRAGWRFELEPLEQGLVLRMVQKAVQQDGEG